MARKDMKINDQKVIIIVGPTASGKSGLAIKLAKKFNGEIISADSRQVYKGMNIGTGKVTKKEQRTAKHHLIDVCSPKRVFTVNDFKKIAQKVLIDIASRSMVPIIVGGTGFYIDVLLGRKQAVQVPPNPKLRTKLEKQSTEHLFKQLQKIDPIRAETVDSKNRHRLIRALEIVLTTGKPVPKLVVVSSKYEVVWLGLRPKDLEKRIGARLDKRLKQGMIKEVQKLHEQGVSWKRLHDLGLEYRQISEYLRSSKYKVVSSKGFKESEYYNKLLTDIIKYSKRQMTWFKKNKEIIWNPRLRDLRVF